MRIVVICEHLPGLSPQQACSILAENLANHEVTEFFIPSGTQGTADSFRGTRITLPTVDPTGRLIESTYVFDKEINQAYIDLSDSPCDPKRADTYGTGVLIADAVTRGATRITLATGGVHTRDAGTGILIALGAQPIDAAGHPVPQGLEGLPLIDDIDTAQLNIPAACVDWLLLTDGAPYSANETFAEFCGLHSELGAGLAITWLSKLMHGTTEHVVTMPASQAALASLATSDILQHHDAVLLITGPTPTATEELLTNLGATNIAHIVVEDDATLDSKLPQIREFAATLTPGQ